MRPTPRIVFLLATIGLVVGLVAAACTAGGTPSVGQGATEVHGEAAREATAEPTAEPTAESPAASAPTVEATSAPTAEPTAEATAVATQAAAPNAARTGTITPITLFMGYIPNVQFAPVYVAIDQGFFRDAGLEVSIEHGFDETDGLTRIGTDRLKFGLISGEQVLLARAQRAPVVYVYRWYQRFPVGIVSPADANLTEPAQLRGKVVGVPGKFGASYIGLQALLNAAGLKEADLKEVRAIGFDTAPVVCGRQVEASVIYIANEPAQIAARCFAVNVMEIAQYANLVSNGLVTNEKTIAEQPELVRSMVAGFDRGLKFTLENPEQAYQISRKFVENLAENDPVQMAVLNASIRLWQAERLGLSDAASWKLTADTLRAMGLLEGEIDHERAFSNDFLP